MKNLISILCFDILLFAGYHHFYKSDLDAQILNGEIQYTEELGWINWGHAKPEKTIIAFNEFQEKNKSAIDSFEFQYAQHMKFKMGDEYLIATFSETRKIPPFLSVKEEKEVFLEIFASVSKSFEEMQGSFPFSLIPSCNASSYRNGDLTGDLISYYLAVSDCSTTDIKSALTMYDKLESYNKFEEEGMHLKMGWRVEKNSNPSNELVMELIEISKWLESDHDELSLVMNQEDRFYFE